MSENISKLVGKYKVYLLPGIAVAITAALFVLVVIPQLIIAYRANVLLSQTKSRVTLLQNKKKALQNIDVNSYQSNLNVALTALPSEQDLPEAFSQLQALIGKNNLQLQDTSFSGASGSTQTDSSGPQSFQIKMDVSGTVSSIKDFVNSLESAPEVMKITGLDVSGAQEGQTQATVLISVYYQSFPTISESVEQPVTPLTQNDISLLSSLQKDAQSVSYVTSSEQGPRGKSNPFQ